MPVDATGTPTSHFSLPTYDTANDAPSGLGFNSFAAAVDTALYGRAPKPSSGTGVGQALGWDPAANGGNGAFTIVNYSLSGSVSIGVALALGF